MYSLYLSTLRCNKAPWKNSVTEWWFTLYKTDLFEI